VAEPGTGSSIDVFLRPWLKILKTRCERAGLLTPQYVFGLAWSGAMSARRLSSLLRCLPHGLSEIYLHPATSDQFAGAAPGYRYAEEFAALISPNVLDAAKRTRVRRGGFADFGPVGAAT